MWTEQDVTIVHSRPRTAATRGPNDERGRGPDAALERPQAAWRRAAAVDLPLPAAGPAQGRRDLGPVVGPPRPQQGAARRLLRQARPGPARLRRLLPALPRRDEGATGEH